MSPTGQYSDELAEIAGKVLGKLSQEGASRKAKGQLSGPTFGRLLQGKIPTEPTLRTFGSVFWQGFCEHFGDEVRAEYGTCSQETAADWICAKMGFGRRVQATGVAGDKVQDAPSLTYEAVTDDAWFRAFSDIKHPEDREFLMEMAEGIRKRRRRIAE